MYQYCSKSFFVSYYLETRRTWAEYICSTKGQWMELTQLLSCSACSWSIYRDDFARALSKKWACVITVGVANAIYDRIISTANPTRAKLRTNFIVRAIKACHIAWVPALLWLAFCMLISRETVQSEHDSNFIPSLVYKTKTYSVSLQLVASFRLAWQMLAWFLYLMSMLLARQIRKSPSFIIQTYRRCSVKKHLIKCFVITFKFMLYV